MRCGHVSTMCARAARAHMLANQQHQKNDPAACMPVHECTCPHCKQPRFVSVQLANGKATPRPEQPLYYLCLEKAFLQSNFLDPDFVQKILALRTTPRTHSFFRSPAFERTNKFFDSALSEPFSMDGQRYCMSISIGADFCQHYSLVDRSTGVVTVRCVSVGVCLLFHNGFTLLCLPALEVVLE